MTFIRFLTVSASVLAMLASFSAGAQIYKWKDKDGVVRYSDIPPPSNVQHESIKGKKSQPNPADAKSPNGEFVPPPAPVIKSSPEPIQQRVADPEQEARAKAQEEQHRKESCAAARANLNTFERGGRINRMNAEGELEFFGEEEIAQQREQARRDVEKFCK